MIRLQFSNWQRPNWSTRKSCITSLRQTSSGLGTKLPIRRTTITMPSCTIWPRFPTSRILFRWCKLIFNTWYGRIVSSMTISLLLSYKRCLSSLRRTPGKSRSRLLKPAFITFKHYINRAYSTRRLIRRSFSWGTSLSTFSRSSKIRWWISFRGACISLLTLYRRSQPSNSW